MIFLSGISRCPLALLSSKHQPDFVTNLTILSHPLRRCATSVRSGKINFQTNQLLTFVKGNLKLLLKGESLKWLQSKNKSSVKSVAK